MSEVDRLRQCLERIAENTDIPADKRDDLNWLRTAVSLAHVYAKAGMRSDVLAELSAVSVEDDRLERRRKLGHQ